MLGDLSVGQKRAGTCTEEALPLAELSHVPGDHRGAGMSSSSLHRSGSRGLERLNKLPEVPQQGNGRAAVTAEFNENILARQDGRLRTK